MEKRVHKRNCKLQVVVVAVVPPTAAPVRWLTLKFNVGARKSSSLFPTVLIM